jgi:hypothetical protein
LRSSFFWPDSAASSIRRARKLISGPLGQGFFALNVFPLRTCERVFSKAEPLSSMRHSPHPLMSGRGQAPSYQGEGIGSEEDGTLLSGGVSSDASRLVTHPPWTQ